METDTAAETILANLKNVCDEGFANAPGVSLNQIKMWLSPQKSEHDYEFDINRGYFETLVQQAVGKLLNQGYISRYIDESVEDGDSAVYSLTEKGSMFVQDLFVTHD